MTGATLEEDTEMVDAEVIEAERPGHDGRPAPRRSPEPEEVPEQVPDPPEENPEEVTGEGHPGDPDPQDDAAQPYRQVLQGFRTVAQTFPSPKAVPAPISSEPSGDPLGNLPMTTGLSSTVPPTLSIAGLNPSAQQWPVVRR